MSLNALKIENFQYEGLIDEVTRRISHLEKYLARLHWWHFSKKRECRDYLERYRSHLRSLEAYKALDERILSRRFIDQVWVDVLASPAPSNA